MFSGQAPVTPAPAVPIPTGSKAAPADGNSAVPAAAEAPQPAPDLPAESAESRSKEEAVSEA
jgi:hypothetical protein